MYNSGENVTNVSSVYETEERIILSRCGLEIKFPHGPDYYFNVYLTAYTFIPVEKGAVRN